VAGYRRWASYGVVPGVVPTGSTPDEELRPELADVGRLARRGLRAVVGAARAVDRPRLSRILGDHLGPGATAFDVVEETWRGYDHVNVQAGLDAWLADPRRTWELVGVANFQHAMFGLGDLLAGGGGSHDPMGLRPGNPATVNLACGPDGEVRPCLRCGLYLVTQGAVRTALLLREADPHSATIRCRSRSSAPTRPQHPGSRRGSGRRRWSTTCSAGRCSASGRRSSATARRCCSSTADPRWALTS
jgi:hypothetical protein